MTEPPNQYIDMETIPDQHIEPPDNVAIIAQVAQHPTVRLHFNDIACYQFARYYQHMQEKSTELLSLLEVIEHYRCVPIAELVKEMKE